MVGLNSENPKIFALFYVGSRSDLPLAQVASHFFEKSSAQLSEIGSEVSHPMPAGVCQGMSMGTCRLYFW